MVRKNARNKVYAAVAVLAALLIVIAVIALIKSHPSTPASDSTTSTETSSPAPKKKMDSAQTPSTNKADTTQPSVDPATVSTVDITPMSLTVSYTKGIGGFDYAVQRTPSGTQYVQFSASQLAGTKCTNDEGTFAYIIESPSSDDTTVNKTTTVDGTTYGLSLADTSCTSNPDLLKQYQTAFSDAFTMLKKM